MQWNRIALPLLLLASLASGIPSPLSAETPPLLQADQIDQLKLDGDRLADQADYLGALEKYTQAYLGVVSEIRGQAFTEVVRPNIYNREALGEEMLRLMKDEFTEDELLLMDSSFKVLGLVEPTEDCAALMTKLLTEEVAGFYDPDKKRMVLIVEDGPAEQPNWLGRLLGARPTFDKDEQKTTLAHELTHALQDQLYDLNAMEAGIEDDDDMLIAFSALVEGDATLLMFVEAQDTPVEEMDPEAMRATFNLMSWMMPLAGGETYRKAPPIFRDSLTFPYLQGMLFVLAQAGQGGWPAVHEAYASPPLSTEQILHPSKYVPGEQYDAPQRVRVPDLVDSVGERWQRLGGNCLGELQTGIMLRSVGGGRRAAEGWDGDRYEVYRRDDGKLAVVSVSVWDSSADAQQYFAAYLAYRGLQAGESQGESDQLPGDAAEVRQAIDNANASRLVDRVFSEGSQRLVAIRGQQVFVVEGFGEANSTRVFERLLDETSFAEKTFPPPVGDADQAAESAIDERPNVIVFVADDLGWDDCGAYGHPSIRTPRLDQLAADGMRFDRAYLTCSSCSPSRCSMLTGRYPHSTGAGELHLPLPADQTLLTKPLREAGYWTAAVGKWHLGKAAEQQIDLVQPATSEQMGDAWVAALQNRPANQPFLLWAAHIDPHRSYQPGAIEPPHTLDDVVVPPYLPDTKIVRHDLALYYDEVSRFDAHVGMVLDELERQRIADNTLVIVISDNGRPFPHCKTRVTVPGVRTPLLVRWPKMVGSGGVQTHLVSTLDLAPTILEVAGLPALESFQGVSFRPLLDGQATRVREFAFAEHNWHDYRAFERSVFDEHYCYVRNWLPDIPGTPPADAVTSITYRDMQRLRQAGELDAVQSECFVAPRPQEFLFDVRVDPHCIRNLAAESTHRRVLKRLSAELDGWQKEYDDHFPGEEALTPDGFNRETGKRLINAAHPSLATE